MKPLLVSRPAGTRCDSPSAEATGCFAPLHDAISALPRSVCAACCHERGSCGATGVPDDASNKPSDHSE